jgi:hypothetical protein
MEGVAVVIEVPFVAERIGGLVEIAAAGAV